MSALKKKIKDALNIKKYFLVQKKMIKAVSHKGDVCLCAPTGSGKTISYVLLIVLTLQKRNISCLRAVVIVPSVELVKQVNDVFCSVLSIFNVKKRIKTTTRFCEANKKVTGDILIATVDTFLSLMQEPSFGRSIRQIVFDEADFLLEKNGHAIEKILQRLSEIESSFSLPFCVRIQRLFVSASIDGRITKAELRLRNPLIVENNTQPNNLVEYYSVCDLENKEKIVSWLLLNKKHKKIFCFVNRKETMDRLLASNLTRKEDLLSFCGMMNKEKKQKAFKAIKAKESCFVICTDEIARGIDIPTVDCVINYEMPKSKREYIHRIGRTARGIQRGTSYSLVTEEELRTSDWFSKRIKKIENLVI